MSMQELTPTPVVHLDLEARLWMLSVKWLRYQHLVVNVICVTIASINYNPNSADQTASNAAAIFFLSIAVLLMIASLALLIWRWTASCMRTKHTTLPKPIHEVIYYVISGISLSVAIMVFTANIALSEHQSSDYKQIYFVVGLAAFNVWMYFRSAFRLWILTTPQY